jgi:hypothetical protein
VPFEGIKQGRRVMQQFVAWRDRSAVRAAAPEAQLPRPLVKPLVREVPDELAMTIQHFDPHAPTRNELLLQYARLRQHVA